MAKETAGGSGNGRVAFTVCSWFVLNISIANVTKWTFLYGQICPGTLFGECEQFKFPLLVTVVHMLFCWGMCFIYLRYVRGTLHSGPQLGFEEQLRSIAPLAACVAGSFAAGNLSLKYIYPSFNQMLGSMTPLVTVIIAFTFQGKRYSSWTWFSIALICGGLLLCSVKEVNFHVLGVTCAILSTILRAAKSIVQGQLLTPEKKLDAVTLLYYMAPWSAAFLFIGSLSLEGTKPLMLLHHGSRNDVKGTCNVLMLLGLGGLNACLLNIANFQVTADTSAVMLNVLGNVKSCIGIGVSVLLFGNALTLGQIAGVAICLLGVYFYKMPSQPESPPHRSVPSEMLQQELASESQEVARASGGAKGFVQICDSV